MQNAQGEGKELAKKLISVNLFGAPGQGKSAVRSGVFWLLRSHRASMEEVSEYAKYLVLSDRLRQLQEDQLYILAKQHHKQLILVNKYALCVTDSPLLLASYYAQPARIAKGFNEVVRSYWDQFENVNFFLSLERKDGEFEETGRVHGEAQSKEIETTQRSFLDSWGIPYEEIRVAIDAPWVIMRRLKEIYPEIVPDLKWAPPEPIQGA